MSLNWDASDTNIYADVMTRGEGAAYTERERNMLDAIVWTTMAVDMPGIKTAEDAEEFAWRAGFVATLGRAVYVIDDAMFSPTINDLAPYVGLTTNVSLKTRNAFIKQALKGWKPEALR